ncbi:MAG: serine/threonine-protein kinase [Deltaproteobacteria bacterium]|nr:serine/threonine-protein kinase [Deltaproteobacteria bacterium]
MDRAESVGTRGDDTRVVTGAPTDPATVVPASGVRSIGRYIVVAEAGSGGMGRVYRAYDPKLHREVALKMLKLARAQTSDMARVMREAQAMAQLSHPNVVPVYDVERAGASVFIAMEYVAGKTLRHWARERHPWPRVLEVYIQAGRGLAAAHAAGIVHRDFKPANAILGEDGRVRVMDFGLARGVDIDVSGPQALPSHSGSDFSLSDPLTEAGTVMGTPAYMAPEQAQGIVADAASDQYSFCVALFGGLFGARPFRADDAKAMRRAKARKAIDYPAGHDVPMWVQRVVERGLEPKPADRWPSVNALLEALANDPRKTRRRRVGIVLGSAGLLGVGAGAVQLAQQGPQPCSGARSKLDGVWDEPSRGVVADAFAATALSYAPTTSARVEQRLDAYADAWVREHTDACEATELRKEQSATLLDARMRCLDARREVFGALVVTLGQADAAVVEKSVQAVGGLPAVDRCADPAYVMAAVAPPDDAATAAVVREHELSLARARALALTGRYGDALEVVSAVAEQAAGIDYLPLQVSTAAQNGALQERIGNYEASEASLRRAFFDARRTGQDEIRVHTAVRLVVVVGERLARHAEGRMWAEHAGAELEVAGRQDDRAELLNNQGLVALAAGDPEAALAHHREALALREDVFGPEAAQVAVSLNNVAGAKYGMGDAAGAAEDFERALHIRRQVLGAEHPDVAASYGNLATALIPLGKLDEAESHSLEGIRILEDAFGPDHPLVGTMNHNLGTLYLAWRDPTRAEKRLLRGLRIRRRALEPDHPLVAVSLSALSAAQMARDDQPAAITSLTEALEIQTKSLGPEHPDLAVTLNNLGNAYFNTEDYPRALEYQLRNAEVRRIALGPDHPKLAMSLANLGRALVANERAHDAIVQLERACEIQDQVSGQEGIRGTMYQYLADALWAAGRKVEAVQRVKAARVLFVKAGAVPEDLAEVDRWLAEHVL